MGELNGEKIQMVSGFESTEKISEAQGWMMFKMNNLRAFFFSALISMCTVGYILAEQYSCQGWFCGVGNFVYLIFIPPLFGLLGFFIAKEHRFKEALIYFAISLISDILVSFAMFSMEEVGIVWLMPLIIAFIGLFAKEHKLKEFLFYFGITLLVGILIIITPLFFGLINGNLRLRSSSDVNNSY